MDVDERDFCMTESHAGSQILASLGFDRSLRSLSLSPYSWRLKAEQRTERKWEKAVTGSDSPIRSYET